MTDGSAALIHWDFAYKSFADLGDEAGCNFVAQAALVLCVVDQASMRHVQDWLQRSRASSVEQATEVSAILQHWAVVSAFVLNDGEDDGPAASKGSVAAHHQPDPDSVVYLQRQLEPLNARLSLDERLITAQILVTYYLQVGQTHRFEELRDLVESGSSYDLASPLMRARWCYTYGYAQYHISRSDEAIEAWHKGLNLSQANGLHVITAMLSLGFARIDVDRRLIESARQRMSSIPRRFGPGREAFRVYREQIAGRIDLLDSMPATALSLLSKSLSAARSAKFSVAECGGCHSDRVQAMLAMEHFSEAISELERLVIEHRSRNKQVFECYLHLIRAWDLRLRDSGQAKVQMAAGLHLIDVLDFGMFFRLLPSFVADVCALALAWGIERPLVYQILKTRSLTLGAPSHADEHWPWAVWVRMLGDDAILVAGEDVADSAKKMPSKTLQLMRFLCCQTTLSADLLEAATAVWPELFERAGLDPIKRDKLLRRNVEERIRDLRELVGNAAWIKVADSKVRLDARAINSDVCARRRLVLALKGIADRARVPSVQLRSTELAQADALMASITELSGGELLPTFDDYEWVDEARTVCDDDLRDARAAVAQIRSAVQRGLA